MAPSITESPSASGLIGISGTVTAAGAGGGVPPGEVATGLVAVVGAGTVVADGTTEVSVGNAAGGVLVGTPTVAGTSVVVVGAAAGSVSAASISQAAGSRLHAAWSASTSAAANDDAVGTTVTSIATAPTAASTLLRA